MSAINKNIPVVLLAAGEARRLAPLSDQIIKPLVPILGVPIIERKILRYYEEGFSNFIIVIGPQERQIQNNLKENSLLKENKITIDYAIQDEAKGMADAIMRTKSLIKEKFASCQYYVVAAADVIFGTNTLNLMFESHKQKNSALTLSLVESIDDEMANGHGNVKMDENKKITKIVEKPGMQNKISNFYSMPVYIFPIEIFDYIEKLKPSKRGELEIQDAIDDMIKDEKIVSGVDILPEYNGKFPFNKIGSYHITFPKDILPMSFRLLKNSKYEFEGEYPTTIEPVYSEGIIKTGDSVLIGPNVIIGKNSELNNLVEISNSILMGNNIIKRECKITNSIIGPNVTIEANESIQNALILEEKESKL